MERVNVCFVDGAFVPEAEASISAFDRGFLYGDGLFETLRTYRGEPFLLGEHWRRLTGSAAFLGIPVPQLDPALAVSRLLEANQLPDAIVRITLSRGPLPGGPRPGGGEGKPTLLLQARPLRPNLAGNAAHGVAAARLPWPLRARGLPWQRHKTLAYLPSVLALGALPEGVEPLLENTEGQVAETATANVFWVSGGRLFTPSLDCGCLPGIARATVLRLAAARGLPTDEGAFTSTDLASADEAFLTNSVVEVCPLVVLDDRPVGPGHAGPATRALQEAYRALVSRSTGARP